MRDDDSNADRSLSSLELLSIVVETRITSTSGISSFIPAMPRLLVELVASHPFLSRPHLPSKSFHSRTKID